MSAQKSITLRNGDTATKTIQDMIPGDRGVERTMEEMVRLVNTDVHDAEIRKVAASLRRATVEGTIKATFDWLTSNYKYHTDGADEHLTSPWITVRKASPYKAFDCDDMSMLLSALLSANKIDSAFKAIAWRETDPPNQYTHVYTLARIPGKGWIPLDAVMGKDGFGNERSPIYRSLIMPVRLTKTGLSDEPEAMATSINMDWDAVGLEVGERIYKGENVANIMKDVVKRICIAGFKAELAARRPMLIMSGVGIAAAFITGGFFLGRSSRKVSR